MSYTIYDDSKGGWITATAHMRWLVTKQVSGGTSPPRDNPPVLQQRWVGSPDGHEFWIDVPTVRWL